MSQTLAQNDQNPSFASHHLMSAFSFQGWKNRMGRKSFISVFIAPHRRSAAFLHLTEAVKVIKNPWASTGQMVHWFH